MVNKTVRDRQRATAASAPLILGGREFQMSPLTDKDIAELDNWVQQRCITVARDSVAGCTEKIRQETLSIAMEVAISLTWMSGRGAKILATVQGMTRLCWQSIKKNHPDVTPDELQALLLDPRNMDSLNDTFAKLNSGESGAEAQGKKVPVGGV